MNRAQVSLLWVVPLAILIATFVPVTEGRGPQPFSLSGSYEWQGQTGPLEATFKPSRDAGRYSVKFKFEFGGKSKTWSGSATGNPLEGPLECRVEGQGGRIWMVRGATADGLLTATHLEVRGGEEQETGTLTLRAM